MGAMRRAAAVAAAVGAAVALVTAGIGFWLARGYRPGMVWPQLPEPGAPASPSEGWSDWHRVTSGVLVVLAAVVVVLAALEVLRDRSGIGHRGRVTVGAGVLALVAGVATIATRSMVEWDQLGLWAVTVGGDVDGYWFAAFSDEVRFVFVDGREVSPGEYGVSLVIHLAAPVLAALGLAAVAVEERRSLREATDGRSPGSAVDNG